MFRLSPNEALDVLSRVESGQSWTFEHPVSKQQAEKVIPYLTSLGFKIRRVSEKAPIKFETPAPTFPSDEEVTEETVEAEEVQLSRAGNVLECSFKGDALEITALYLKLWVFSLLTLGVYSFWGRTQLRRYVCSQMLCAGEPFSYHGNPRELAATGIKLIVVLLTIFFFLVWLHGIDPLLSPVFENLFLIAGIFSLPYLMWQAIRYRISKIRWLEVEFSFQATFWSYFGLHVKGWLLTGLTLGLYGPVYWSEAWKFRVEQTEFGGRSFRYSGQWRNLARPYFIGWGVTAVTLGWGAPVWLWSWFEIKKTLWMHTHFDRGNFDFNAEIKSYVLLQLANLFILIFSLGLGYPCVKKRNLEYTASHLALTDFSQWQQQVEEWKNETRERKKQVFQNFRNV